MATYLKLPVGKLPRVFGSVVNKEDYALPFYRAWHKWDATTPMPSSRFCSLVWRENTGMFLGCLSKQWGL